MAALKSRRLWQTKTCWLNMLGIGALVIPGLPIDPHTLGYVMAGLNIGNRLLTVGPATVLGDAATAP